MQDIGGQALINGVIFRTKKWVSIARRQEGQILVEVYPTVEPSRWQRALSKLPVLRGIFMFLLVFISFLQTLSKRKRDKKFWSRLGKNLIYLLILFLILPNLIDFFLLPLRSYDNMLPTSFSSSLLILVVEKFLTYLMVFLSFVALSNFFYPTLFAYHGAEHKAIMTYERKKPLVLEEARQSSRLHPRCGTGLFTLIVLLDSFLLTPVLAYLRISYSLFWQLILIGLGYEVMLFFRKHQGFACFFLPLTLMLQRITTKEPNIEQLEVALAALEALPEK